MTQVRTDYELSAFLTAKSGQIFLTGTQALVRLPLVQRWMDEADGLNTAGFVSGYRGSPLGAVRPAALAVAQGARRDGIEFLPR